LQAELLAAAGRSLTRARQLEPLELEHYANSGILYAYWSETADPARLQAAIAFYQQALRLAPPRVGLRIELGHIYYNHGRYQDALAQYEAALAIDPRSADAHYRAGLAWQALGRQALARQAFQAAEKLAP
jgi:tetratricopeptide (TPR) repeat protein